MTISKVLLHAACLLGSQSTNSSIDASLVLVVSGRFALKFSCCCAAFAMQVCYCLLAQLGVLELFMGCGTHAGVQLNEAAGIWTLGCLQCTCRVVSGNISQSKCSKPVSFVPHSCW